MPNSKSAKKSLKQSKNKKEINTRSKIKMKKIIKSLNDLINILNILKNAYKQIDKTAKNRIIKKNTASRKKSVLARRVNSLQKKISKK
jgi:small subunit ribosomal protein S20